MIKIIALRINEPATLENMENSLKPMKDFVGGYIEGVMLPRPGLLLICNEQGKLIGLPPNRFMSNDRQTIVPLHTMVKHKAGIPDQFNLATDHGDLIMGNCFITRVDCEGNNVSVTMNDFLTYEDC